ncbi:MAG: carboxypeptidase-like regulatory domain-containing protein [Thermoplasmata archaeon]
MLKRYGAVMVCTLMLTFPLLYPSVLGAHEDFDEAEEDIDALLSALRIVHINMVDALNSTVSVDYTFDAERMEFNYTEGPLKDAQERSYQAFQGTDPARQIIDDIEGEVPSYVYLHELYLPYYNTSHTLNGFSQEHIGVLLNISSAVDLYAESNGTDYTLMSQGLQSIEDALLNLQKMEDHHMSLSVQIGNLNRTVMNPAAMEDLTQELPVLIQRYRDLIDQILASYEHVPPYLSLNVPESVHPSETFTCSGFYWNRSFIAGEEISIIVQGIGNFTVDTDKDGHYSMDVKVPWDMLGVIGLNASTSQGMWVEANITVEKYDTEIVVTADKLAYYREDITIEGRFRTEATVDLSLIRLNASHIGDFTPGPSGQISLEYNSSDFRWGDNQIEVKFSGNDTLKPSSAEARFEISVPTVLLLDGVVQEKNVSFNGTLYNETHGTGLPGERIYLYLDDYSVSDSATDSNGNYSFNLTIDDISPGHYTVTTRYYGSDIYRHTTSSPFYLLVTDDSVYISPTPIENGEPNGDEPNGDDPNGDDDHLLSVLDHDMLILFLVAFMLLLITVFYLKNKKEEDKEEPVETATPKKRKVELTKKSKDVEIIETEDVLESYGEFVYEIDSRDIIRLSPGKTHREIQEDMIRLYGLRDHFETVTGIFEKISFTDISADREDIKRYRRSMEKIWGVCFS